MSRVPVKGSFPSGHEFPEFPLSKVKVYQALQQTFVDPLQVDNDNQVHYQDHGTHEFPINR
jgi:hypothetical protein